MKFDKDDKKSEILIRNDKYWKEYFSNPSIVWNNTAIVLYHGVGNQLPVRTLDDFVRNLVETLSDFTDNKIILKYKPYIYKKGTKEIEKFYNCISINIGNKYTIDVYEYYWAHQTQDKANVSDIQNWISNVVGGAKEFYQYNAQLGKKYKDTSIFFSPSGKLRKHVYSGFLNLVFLIIPLSLSLIKFVLFWLSRIPVIGYLFTKLLDLFTSKFSDLLTNVVGDLTIYNSFDPKSKFFHIRKTILDKSLNFLTEVVFQKSYKNLIIAGHSLGSEIAYDTVNAISFLSQTMDESDKEKPEIDNLKNILKGFITFGSPLDKIVFFVQEKAKQKNYVLLQLLSFYRCFRQSRLPFYPRFKVIANIDDAFMPDVKWRNYFDEKDYVSGSLDYFKCLTNVKCFFPKSFFTHGNYWNDKYFYLDVIKNFIIKK